MPRKATIERKTKETDIRLALNLDGMGQSRIKTGIGFLDHMLDHVARHGLLDLDVTAQGDLEVDDHHTVEDVFICLGQALGTALGDKAGINRYGFGVVPMDDALAEVAVDLSGRAALVFNAKFNRPRIGTFDVELVEEALAALARAAKLNLHVNVPYGKNNHHIAEAIFKALGRALRQAVEPDPRRKGIPSTKGVL